MIERTGDAMRWRRALLPLGAFAAAVHGAAACGNGGAHQDLTRALPPAIAAVLVTPGFTSVVVGDSSPMSVLVLDSAGAAVTGGALSWRSSEPSRATVTESGMVRAHQAGETRIFASAGEVSGEATVAVVAKGCDGPPPWSCEPAGMTVLSDYGFDQLAGGPWGYQKKWGYAQIATDSTAPSSAPGVSGRVLEFVYPQGFTSAGESPAAVHSPALGAAGWREVYWGFDWKANAEWQNHQSNINKILFGWLDQKNDWGMTWHWGRATKPNGQPLTQFISFFEQGPAGRYYLPNTNEAFPLVGGRWYRIELYFRPSSATGVADGVVRVWVNGVLQCDYSGVVTTPGAITETYFDPTWGGVGGPAKSRQDYFRVDRVRLSAR